MAHPALPELRSRRDILYTAWLLAKDYHFDGGECTLEDIARFEGRYLELDRTIQILEETPC